MNATRQTHPTPFAELNSVLTELVAGAQSTLGGNFVGAYLQGSFALGQFDAYSDLDFTIATREDVPEALLPALDGMHTRLHSRDEEWAQHLEGSYVPLAVLRSAPAGPYPLLYLNNGDRTLIRSEHDNTNVVRWVLRNHGIALAGPAPRELVDPIEPETLRAEVRATMRSFGDELLSGTMLIGALWLQGFTVLFYCRALQSLATAAIPSKPASVAWAKATLDPRWAPLIDDAWTQRARYPRGRGALEAHAALAPSAESVEETLAFVRYALEVAALVPETRVRQP